MYNKLKQIQGRLKSYMNQLPLIGFNSSNYDINLIKTKLFLHLGFDQKKAGDYVIKRNNSYSCISNAKFRFLDVSDFLAPGSSYAGFLQAYGIEDKKGFFPYEYFDSMTKLDETEIPAHKDFYSSLKDVNISETEYQLLKEIWVKEEMKTFKDFLIWYNNKDVEPFVKAIEKLQQFYFDKSLDVFKIAISVPGIARVMLFNSCRKDKINFQIFSQEDEDLYKTFQANIVGGPSIIFHRHHKKDHTLVRGGKLCKKIVGYDASALYLHSIGSVMPTGVFVRRFESNDFKPEKQLKYVLMYEWLEWIATTKGIDILHKLNTGREKRIGPYFVDGYCSQTRTVYEVS